MRYYVVTDDGQKYGPADIPTLNQWIAESRLLPTQMLEEEASGARFAAQTVTGLNFPVPVTPTYAPGGEGGPGAGSPTYSGYHRGSGYQRPSEDGSRDMTPAWVLFGVGLLPCPCFPYPSIALAAVGVYFANRARQRGHSQAAIALGLNIALLLVAIVWSVVFVLWGTFINDLASRSGGR